MRGFIKALPLGLLLPLVIGAASVKPDDAVSNIAGWAYRFGIAYVPAWVSNPAADNRILIGSFGVAFIYAFLIWTLPIIKENRARPGTDTLKNHLMLLLFLFLSAAFVVVIWRFVPSPPSRGASTSPPSPQLLSRMDRFIFACDVPPPEAAKAATFPQEKEYYKQNLEVWGDAIGMSFTLSEIRGGVRIVAEANTAEARRRLLGSVVSKLTIEIRRVGQQEIVTLFIDLPELLRFWSFMAPDPSAAEMIEIQGKMEKLIGASEGKCHLI